MTSCPNDVNIIAAVYSVSRPMLHAIARTYRAVCCKVYSECNLNRGVANILHWGHRSWAPKARELRRRRRRGDGVWGGGVPLPNQLGSLGNVVISLSGVRAEPLPPTHLAYLRLTEHFW